MTEKQVAMTFAGLMTERLKKTYKVVLTRKDDYQIDVFERPALANHIKADLFISLHTGGSLRSFPRGMSLFYYSGPSRNAAAFEPLTSIPAESSSAIKTWEHDRPELVEKNRHLTELIRKRVTQADKKLKLTTSGAPLIVLSGAEMPAVLIEIGTITNPLDAKTLNDETSLSNLARVIGNAIDDFFSNEHRL
jgi:N-acetylmuramoyl-L-alanine amidase